MMNRRQKSPLRLRPKKIDVDVNRIINHAAKLVMEYNQIKIDNIMESKIDNQEKVKELLRLSSTKLPKLTSRSKNKRHKENYQSRKYSKPKIMQIEEQTEITENKKNNSIYSSFLEEINSQLDLKSDNDEENSEFPEGNMEQKSNLSKGKSQKSERTHYSTDPITQPSSNRTLDEIMTFTSISSVKDIKIKNEDERTFIYEVNVLTGSEESISSDLDVFIIINGEDNKTSEKLFLREYFQKDSSEKVPFLPGNNDNFSIYLHQYFGTIESIIVGLNAPAENTAWFVESLCIIDNITSKTYGFTCRRWLGPKSADHLTEIKVGYTSSYKKASISNISSAPNSEMNNSEHIIQSNLSSNSSNHNQTLVQHDNIYPVEKSYEYQSKSPVDNTFKEDSVNLVPSSDIKETEESYNFTLIENGLHSAIKCHDFEKVKELCSSVDSLKYSEDEDGNTPIHIAAIYYEDNETCKAIIDLLISLKADPDWKNSEGFTPYLLAVECGNIDSVKYFKDILKVDTSATDLDNNTALHLATLKGYNNIVQYILLEDSDIYQQNKWGETPGDIAQNKNNLIILNMFIKIIQERRSSSSNDIIVQKNVTEENIKDIRDNIVFGHESHPSLLGNSTNDVREESLYNNEGRIYQNLYDDFIKKTDEFDNDDAVEVIEGKKNEEVNDNLNLLNNVLVTCDNKSNESLAITDGEQSKELFDMKRDEISPTLNERNENLNFEHKENNELENSTQKVIVSSAELTEPEDYEDDNRGILFNKAFPSERKPSKLEISNFRKVQFEDTSSPESSETNSLTSVASSGPSSSLTIDVSNSSSSKDKNNNKKRNKKKDTKKTTESDTDEISQTISHPKHEDDMQKKNNEASILTSPKENDVNQEIEEMKDIKTSRTNDTLKDFPPYPNDENQIEVEDSEPPFVKFNEEAIHET